MIFHIKVVLIEIQKITLISSEIARFPNKIEKILNKIKIFHSELKNLQKKYRCSKEIGIFFSIQKFLKKIKISILHCENSKLD